MAACLGLVLACAGAVVGVAWLVRRLRPAQPAPPALVVAQASSEYRAYQDEILATAERNFETLLPGEVRDDAARARDRGNLRWFADLVDGGVRERTAVSVVEAFFRGDAGPVEEFGTARLRAALTEDALRTRRERLGPVATCESRPWSGVDQYGTVPISAVRFDATFESGAVADVEVDLAYEGAGVWRVTDIAVLPYPPGRRRTPRPASDREIERESCDGCGAIRFRAWHLSQWQVVHDRTDHSHTWRRGAPSGPQDAVEEGVVVLVSRPPVVAGFVLHDLDLAPSKWGRCDYDWAWREDGGTSLDPSDPAVKSGRTTGAARIRVGGVTLSWSLASRGKAWLRYPREAGESIADEDPRICVTTLRSLRGCDAADPRWRYSASPSDPGIRLADAPK